MDALDARAFRLAVWGIACSGPFDEGIANDFILSRIHGLDNIDALVAEWSKKLPVPEQTIRTYLTTTFTMFLTKTASKACASSSARREGWAYCRSTAFSGVSALAEMAGQRSWLEASLLERHV